MAKEKDNPRLKTGIQMHGAKIVILGFVLIFLFMLWESALKFPPGQTQWFLTSHMKEVPTLFSQEVVVYRDSWTTNYFVPRNGKFHSDAVRTDNPLVTSVPYFIKVNGETEYPIDPRKKGNLDIKEQVRWIQFRIAPEASSSVTRLHVQLDRW